MEFLHFVTSKKIKTDLLHCLFFWVGISFLIFSTSLQAQIRKPLNKSLQVQKSIQFPAVQQALPASEAQQIEEIINDEIAKQELIGVAIGVVNNGQIAYTKGHGYADRARKKAVTLDSKFRWASMSKSLTSIAALKLWENGKLDLEKDINNYVSNFPKKGVNMKYLLQNQGGIGHYSEMDKDYPNWDRLRISYPSDQAYSAYLSVNIFKDAPLQYTPGRQYMYSTFGFNLAGAAIETAGKNAYKKGYVALVDEYIARPLGMTTLAPDYKFGSSAAEVQGYYKNNSGEIIQRNDDDISWKLPGGGFHSTIGDLTKFVHGLINKKILKSATYDMAWAKQNQQDENGSVTNYGYGFGVNGSGANLRVWHSGSQTKVKTLYFCYPNQGVGVAIMCNSEWANTWIIADRILKVLGISRSVDDYEWNCEEDKNPSEHRFAGVWQSGNSEHIIRVGYTHDEFNQEWKDLAEKGYRLMDFETHLDGEERKWDGVFVKSEGKYAMWRGFNEEDFAAKVEEMASQGLRLIDVETYRKSGGTQKWAGVFIEGKQKYFFLQDSGLEILNIFNKKWKELSGQGLRLIDVETYTTISGGRKWVGVFMEGNDKYALFRNYTKEDFNAKWKELADQGLRLIDVEVYTSKGKQYWSGVWRAGGGKYALYRNWRFCPFYKKVESLRSEGYELFDLERY